MSDFRANFIHHYVSRFKGTNPPLSADALLTYFAWCEYKLLPLFAGLGRESPILELGCGPGTMLEFLARRGFEQVRGIDISSEQVELARRHGWDAEVGDVFEVLEGKREAFEVIIALDFIEHFHKEELLALAQLFFHSLKEGGRLILQTPNGEGLFPRQIIYGDLTHLTIFTPNSLQQLLREAGFHDFRFYETGPAPKNRFGRVRMSLWQWIRFVANTVRRIETGKSQAIWTENMICRCGKPVAG